MSFVIIKFYFNFLYHILNIKIVPTKSFKSELNIIYDELIFLLIMQLNIIS